MAKILTPLMAEMATISKRDETKRKTRLKPCRRKILAAALTIPNLPDDSVPAGKDENDNVEMRRWGEPPI